MNKLILVFIISIILISSDYAAVPNHICYQGKVDDASGQPIASGNYQMTFSLFRTAVGGTAVWSSGTQTVIVNEGLFSYELGVNVPFPNNLTSDSALWLEINVSGEIIFPRTQFSSVGFAFKAQTADTALYSFSNNGWIDDGTTISTTENVEVAGNLDVDSLKIGAANHEGLLHVEGTGNAVAVIGSTVDGWGVMGRAYGASGVGFYSMVDKAKGLVIDRNGGPSAFMCGTDTGLYVNTYGSGYAGIFDGNVKVTGTTNFMAPIITQGIDQTASWNTGYESGNAIYAGHNGSGNGKCIVFEREGGVSAFLGGIDTGLYVQESGIAGYFKGVVEVNGNFGAGVSHPDAQLQVKGGNWDPGSTEGDFKIGNSTYRFKTGIAMSGGGAGDVRMRSDGGTSRLILGSGLNDVLAVNDTRVGIGTLTPNYTLDVRGNIGNNTTLYHSDRRWKKNISQLNNSLDKILQLKGVSFDWRTKQFADMNFPTGTKIGLIAQDVEKVLPQVVHTDKNGYKSVEYANIVAVLIEAVKEQQVEIERLKELIENQNRTNGSPVKLSKK